MTAGRARARSEKRSVGLSKSLTGGRILSVLLAIAMFAATLPAFAQEYAFDPRTQKKFGKVLEATQAGDTETAKQILLGINLKRAKPYSKARVLQFLGNIYAQEEDFDKALDYFERCVATDALPPLEQLRTMFLVGQLQGMQERWDDALTTLEAWLVLAQSGETPVTSSAYYTLAVTYYQAGRLEEALPHSKKSVELSENPRESWLRLLLSLHLEAENYDEALAILDDLILTYPKKTYWTQMAAIYAAVDDMSKSLAAQQLAKSEGFITEDRDLTRVAQMLMAEGLPHRGAEIMEKGLEDGTIEGTETAYSTYSDTLLQSREWELAVVPLEKAAELKEDGALYMRLAQVHLQIGNWNAAMKALDNAFKKGGLVDEGQAHILYGIAAANDKKWVTAKRAFGRASKFDGTREVAGKWSAYVDREKARLGGG